MQLTITYWRDIPSQILAKYSSNREKLMLSERFQVAIDRAAMRAGKGSSDAYIAEWKRDKRQVTTVPSTVREYIQQLAQEIESEYSDELLEMMIKNKGFKVAEQSNE